MVNVRVPGIRVRKRVRKSDSIIGSLFLVSLLVAVKTFAISSSLLISAMTFSPIFRRKGGDFLLDFAQVTMPVDFEIRSWCVRVSYILRVIT